MSDEPQADFDLKDLLTRIEEVAESLQRKTRPMPAFIPLFICECDIPYIEAPHPFCSPRAKERWGLCLKCGGARTEDECPHGFGGRKLIDIFSEEE